MEKRIVPGNRIGELVAKWSWFNGVENIWKCQCDCGNICYVKELALEEHIVLNCEKCNNLEDSETT